MIPLLAILVLTLASTPPTSSPATAPADAHPPLSLWISRDDTVRFTNQSDATLTILLPIDASDMGLRRVSYVWVVTDAGGAQVPRGSLARCGNVNSLRRSDFITLSSGESHTFRLADTFLGPAEEYGRLPETGTVKLVYSFDPKRRERGVPLDEDDDVADLLRTCPAVRVESNALTIERE